MRTRALAGCAAALVLCAALTPGAAQVSGTVFHDRNGNGLRDAGEEPLAWVGVTLFGRADAGPAVDTTVINPDLEGRMERAERIVMLVRAMRTKSNLKVRQPLPRIILPIASEEERNDVRHVEDIILETEGQDRARDGFAYGQHRPLAA